MDASNMNTRPGTMGPAPVWAREPRIKPNYSLKKYLSFPRNIPNNLKQVLLYTNVTERNMLDAKTRYIQSQQNSCKKTNDLHRQAFVVRQIMQEMQLEALGVNNISLLPKELMKQNRHLAMFHNLFYMGGKDLPMHQRLDRFFIKSLQNARDNLEALKHSKMTLPAFSSDTESESESEEGNEKSMNTTRYKSHLKQNRRRKVKSKQKAQDAVSKPSTSIANQLNFTSELYQYHIRAHTLPVIKLGNHDEQDDETIWNAKKVGEAHTENEDEDHNGNGQLPSIGSSGDTTEQKESLGLLPPRKPNPRFHRENTIAVPQFCKMENQLQLEKSKTMVSFVGEPILSKSERVLIKNNHLFRRHQKDKLFPTITKLSTDKIHQLRKHNKPM